MLISDYFFSHLYIAHTGDTKANKRFYEDTLMCAFPDLWGRHNSSSVHGFF